MQVRLAKRRAGGGASDPLPPRASAWAAFALGTPERMLEMEPPKAVSSTGNGLHPGRGNGPAGRPMAGAIHVSLHPAALRRSDGMMALAINSPNGPAFRAGPRSTPVVALRGSFGNTSSAKR